jgi:ATP-dependent DNA ligase
VRLYTRNGYDFADRLPLAAAAIRKLPARSCVIDGEGRPEADMSGCGNYHPLPDNLV